MSAAGSAAAALRRRLRREACPACHLVVALVMPRTQTDTGATDHAQPAPPPELPPPGPCPSCGRVLAADVSPVIVVVVSAEARVLHARLRDVVAEQPAAHRSTDALTGRADTERPYPDPTPVRGEICAQRASQTVAADEPDEPVVTTAANPVPPAYVVGPVARGQAEWAADDDAPADRPEPGWRRIHQDAPGWPMWLT